MKETLAIVEQLHRNGVLGSYAVGGAVAASFYLEPVATLDVDIFVVIEPAPGSLIANPKRIYDYLTARGCANERLKRSFKM